MIKSKLKTILQNIRHPMVSIRLLSFIRFGYLSEIGWIKSFILKKPVSNNGAPIPWNVYGYIDFISERLNKKMDIFEYGVGNSSLYYQDRVNSLTCVEHDESWFNDFNEECGENVTIHFKSLHDGESYAEIINKQDKLFDVVIVDGRDRVNCIRQSILAIKDSGVIVLDDSHREQYLAGVDYLRDKGFKELPFYGITPGFFSRNCTSIFYRKDNCLNI